MSDKNKCPCCGEKPYKQLRYPNQSHDRWDNMCQARYSEHLEISREINEHEMENFGGAYGLVTWEERGYIGHGT